MALDKRLVTDNERNLFLIGAIISGAVWLVLTCTVAGLIEAGFIGLFILMAHAIFLAHVKGNGVRVTPNQLPDLFARCQAAATKLGLDYVPAVYVVQSGGVLNAFATKLLSRKFVIINSALIDDCEDPRELDFVVGHEIGHLAAGHLTWNVFLIPFHILPWLGPAYSRAREYTCDRCGLDVVGELEPSSRALAVLAAGGKTARQVDLTAFAEQRAESGNFWMATLELVSSHPFLCKRVAALQEYRQPGSAPPVPRTWLAYPLAPILGIAGAGSSALGSIMLMAAIMGMLAAIAIPNFIRYQDRARAAAHAGGRMPHRFTDDDIDSAGGLQPVPPAPIPQAAPIPAMPPPSAAPAPAPAPQAVPPVAPAPQPPVQPNRAVKPAPSRGKVKPKHH